MNATASDFDYITKLVRDRAGLVVGADKAYLLDLRLAPLAQQMGLGTISDLVRGLRAGGEALILKVVEAMTTNETSFFRDNRPFELLRTTVLPQLVAKRPPDRPIRIWCAASSTGQEPYSLAMLLRENAQTFGARRFEIVATDIASHVLKRAEAGVYSHFEVQRGLPIALLAKYFDRKGDEWQVKPELRRMVEFRMQNLMRDLRPLGLFDLVLCRNVLIYFDQPTKAKVLEAIAGQMRSDARLILGGAETVLGITRAFQAIGGQHGAFELAASVPAAAVA